MWPPPISCLPRVPSPSLLPSCPPPRLCYLHVVQAPWAKFAENRSPNKRLLFELFCHGDKKGGPYSLTLWFTPGGLCTAPLGDSNDLSCRLRVPEGSSCSNVHIARVARGRDSHTRPQSWILQNLGSHRGEDPSMLCLHPDPSSTTPSMLAWRLRRHTSQDHREIRPPRRHLWLAPGTVQALAHVPRAGWHSGFTGSPGAAVARLGPRVAF